MCYKLCAVDCLRENLSPELLVPFLTENQQRYLQRYETKNTHLCQKIKTKCTLPLLCLEIMAFSFWLENFLFWLLEVHFEGILSSQGSYSKKHTRAHALMHAHTHTQPDSHKDTIRVSWPLKKMTRLFALIILLAFSPLFHQFRTWDHICNQEFFNSFKICVSEQSCPTPCHSG